MFTSIAAPRRRSNSRVTLRIVGLALAGALILAGCSTSTPTTSTSITQDTTATTDLPQDDAQTLLAKHDLDGLDTKAVITALEQLPVAQRPTDLIASIRPTGLVVSDESTEAVLPMPQDEFYLSVAPYFDETHPCHFHSLTTCRGELASADIQVKITNKETGEVLVDETRTTEDNGFFGFWLPQGIDATVELSAGDRSATADVSTKGDEDATCLTTMQLV